MESVPHERVRFGFWGWCVSACQEAHQASHLAELLAQAFTDWLAGKFQVYRQSNPNW